METDCESNLPAVLFDCLDFPAATTAPPKSGGAKATQTPPMKEKPVARTAAALINPSLEQDL